MSVYRRRTVLVASIALLPPLFAVTQRTVTSYRDSRQHLAAEWAARGDRDIAQHPADAVEDFRTALAYSAGNAEYRFQLARALVDAKRPVEAESHLLTLWGSAPGDGRINLELGRLAVGRGDMPAAVRYYHAAIDGAWPENAAAERRSAAIELARALLDANQRDEAQAELIRLAGDVPDDSRLLTEVGELLRRAGAQSRAMTVFRRALDVDRGNAHAAMLAGQTAFDLGDYTTARLFLTQAAGVAPLDAASRDALQVSDRVLQLDPFARGLPLRQRARRTIAVFETARARLNACLAAPQGATGSATASSAAGASGAAGTGATAGAGAVGGGATGAVTGSAIAPSAYTELQARAASIADRLNQPRVERDDDLLDDALDVAFRIEQLPANVCGAPSVDDRAVALLFHERQDAPR